MEIKSKEISIVDIDSLILNPKNNNKHPKDQIERLAKLIKHQGFRNPLVVSNRSGFVISGHGRIEAARLAGLKHLPVMHQDFDSEASEYAYLTSDNAVASWANLDMAMINSELLEFPDMDLDMLGIKDFVIEFNEVDLPDLNSDEPDCQQVTFILSNEQKDILDEAIKKAKKEEDCSDEINQNSNGNCLAAILKRYVHG
ncbi:MAG: hypothetical protein RLZ75_3048 [Pseudomonadota bacterium]|jgi:hypothetical protein